MDLWRPMGVLQPGGFIRRPGGSAGGDAAATTAFLARTSGLDATHTNAYKALINGLVSDGVFAKLDALWIYATQDYTTARLNLVSTSYQLGTFWSTAFTADQGILTTATVIDTGYSPLTNGVQYTQNAAHLAAWTYSTNTSGNLSTLQVGSSTGGSALYSPYSDGNTYMRVNDSAGGTGGFSLGTVAGFNLGVRSSSTARTGYLNGSSIGTIGSNTSAATASGNVVLGGGVGGGKTITIAAAAAGGDVDSLQSTYYTRMRTYMTAVGVP